MKLTKNRRIKNRCAQASVDKPAAAPWLKRLSFIVRVAALNLFLVASVGETIVLAQQGTDANIKVEVNPLMTHYNKAKTKKILNQIGQDTQSDLTTLSDVAVYSTKTQATWKDNRNIKEKLYLVEYKSNDSCGVRYNVYRKAERYEKLQEFECAKEVSPTRKKTFTNLYPDLIYIRADDPELFALIFKYDGTQYQEAECRKKDSSGPGKYKYIKVECSSRGAVQH